MVATRARSLDFVVPGLAEALTQRAHRIAWSDEALETAQCICVAINDLLSFFADRLKVQLRDQGARHDLVDAVFALEGQDDLLMVVRRVEALGKFLDTDDGKNLLAGTKRAANILRIEEKKDGKAFDGAPDAALYSLAEEKTLAKAIDQVKAEAERCRRQGRLRRRDERDGETASGGRRVLRQGQGQRRRSESARKSPEAAERNPRRDARGRGFFEDTGLAANCRRSSFRGAR